MVDQELRAPKFSRIDADVRRRSLIDATLRCLARDGFGGATVRRICQEAGVSAGLLRHYFDSKDDLFAETYTTMTNDFARITGQALNATPGSPEDRLLAFFEASFSPEFIDPDVLGAWIIFWRMIRSDPNIRARHAEVYAAYRGDLAQVLTQVLAGDSKARGNTIDARLAALSLAGLMDGLWLEISLDPDAFTAGEAITVCRNWLDSFTGRRNVGHIDIASTGKVVP